VKATPDPSSLPGPGHGESSGASPAGQGAHPLVAAAAGLLGTSTALLILLLIRMGGPASGPIDVMADSIARRIPSDLFVTIVTGYGGLAKAGLYAAVCAGLLLTGTLLAVAASRLGLAGRRPAWQAWILLSAAATLLAEGAVLFLGSAGLIDPDRLIDGPGLHLPIAVAAIAYGAMVAILATRPGRMINSHSEVAPPGDEGGSPGGREESGRLGRRAFLVRASVVVGFGALSGSVLMIASRMIAEAARSGRDLQSGYEVAEFGITPAVVPVERFFTVSKDFLPVAIDLGRWRLSVSGLVDHPRDYTIDEVHGLPAVEGYRTLQCVTDEQVSYGPDIGNQFWRGARVRDILGAAGPGSGARFVVWRCADGYYESLPIAKALEDETWLVYEMGPSGTALTPDHGAPLRLLVANRYGMNQPKWVTGMILTDVDQPGWWRRGGWDTQAAAQTYCRIDFPRADGVSDGVLVGTRFTIYGVAAAGDRGVSRVEVSLDGGRTWRDTELEPEGGPTSRLTWRRWRYPAVLERPGEHVLLARSTDGLGLPQDAVERRAFPSGATGYSTVKMTAFDVLPNPPTMPPG
jgi:DMSO/TMAO reductase YedYZ molybdopterin-dependent catalytic subunit